MVDAGNKRLANLELRFADLLRDPVCQWLREILGSQPCHLVGGALRDVALGQHPRDLDIVVAADGAGVADRLAERLGSRSIQLGGHRFAAYRVPRAGSPIDIWDRGAISLEADLLRRDFTIHSFALDLHTGATYDPFSGLQDLLTGRLRMTSTNSFADDPLRVLRLCRFAAQLTEFRVDPATRNQARESVGGLTRVASERIRSEIELVMGQSNGLTAAQLWIDLQVLPGPLLHGSLTTAARRSLRHNLTRSWRRFERAAARLPTPGDLSSGRLALILSWLDESGCGPGHQSLETMQQQGFVTNAAARQVSQLLDTGELPFAEPQQRWFLHRYGELWPVAVSLATAVADPQTTTDRQAASLARIIELAAQRPEEIFDPPGLISGKDLQQRLFIAPGPLLGRVLAAVRRRQIEGTITTRERALEVAAQLLAADELE